MPSKAIYGPRNGSYSKDSAATPLQICSGPVSVYNIHTHDQASLGLGPATNVSLGAANRTVASQPISMKGQERVNLAHWVAGAELRSTA